MAILIITQEILVVQVETIKEKEMTMFQYLIKIILIALVEQLMEALAIPQIMLLNRDLI